MVECGSPESGNRQSTQNRAAEKVTVYKLIVKQSVEEKIQKLQEAKKDLADKVINGETNQLSNMSQEELLEILSC